MYIDQDTGVMIHDQDNIIAMRKAGKLAAEVLDYITPFVKPGVSTEILDKKCYDFILKNKAIPFWAIADCPKA